jgi:hypothetical protein
VKRIPALGAAAAALLLIVGLSGAGRVLAFPSSNPGAVEGTAKLDALMKPPFWALVHPHVRRWYRRPDWAPYWRGAYYGDPCSGYGDMGYPTPGYPGQGYSGQGYPGSGYATPGYPSGGYVDGAYSGGAPGSAPYANPAYPAYPGGAYPNPSYPKGPPTGGGYILDGRYIPVGGPVDGGYGGCGAGYGGGGYGAPSWAWSPTADIGAWGPPPIYPLGGGADHVTVDCRDQSGPRLNSALSQLAPGGTLYLRGRGPACEETMQIQQPVIIAGEPPSAFPLGGDPGPAVIKAPPGQPCAVIAVGPRGGVEFRDVTLEAPNGGQSACLQSWGSAVALVRSTLNHHGEASAVYASGGQLYFSDAEIDGVSDDSTIWVEDAAVVFKNVGVTAVSTALDVRPGGANAVLLDHVTFYAPPGEGAHTATGMLARRSRTLNGRFDLRHVSICGFRNGLVAETGTDVHMDHVLIRHARLGVAVDGGKVEIHDSGIDAGDWGVYAYAGSVTISRTHIFSFARLPIGSDPGAVVDDRDIFIYGDHCGWGGHGGWSCRDRRLLAPFFLLSDFVPHHWGWDPPI